jgi:hypothetical protein
MKRAICCLVVLGCLSWGDTRPNFSGRWRMVKDQSDFGKFSRPDIIVRVVDEHPPTMNIHTVQTTGKETTSSDVSYFIDGRESTNTMSGRPATSKAFWDGEVLVIRTETKNSKDQDTQIVDRWELSHDGQTLTIDSHIETTTGEAELKLVCQKEGAAGK